MRRWGKAAFGRFILRAGVPCSSATTATPDDWLPVSEQFEPFSFWQTKSVTNGSADYTTWGISSLN